MVDLDSNPTKLLEVVEVGKQLLMTRGTLTTFSIANDVAKYFAILPALFMGVFPEIAPLNVMRLASPYSAILSAVIFNALIIIALIPLALRGRALPAAGRGGAAAPQSLLIYGVGGVIVALRRHQAHRRAARRRRAGLRKELAMDSTRHRAARHARHPGPHRPLYPLAVTGAGPGALPARGQRRASSPTSAARWSAPSCIGQGFTQPGLLPAPALGGGQRVRRHRAPPARTSAPPREAARPGRGGRRAPASRRTRRRPGRCRRSSSPPRPAGSIRTCRPRRRCWQVPRVAQARQRGAPSASARWSKRRVEGRDLGFLGEPRVNVLAPQPRARPAVRACPQPRRDARPRRAEARMEPAQWPTSRLQTRRARRTSWSWSSAAKRGRLKLYIGFAAGVGKTYRMLEEAHALQEARRGRGARLRRDARPGGDRGAGGRPGGGSPRGIEYRGVTVEEMDLDAMLARKPAGRGRGRARPHQRSRAAATASATRTCSELLAAGINVIGAFNVQHLESSTTWSSAPPASGPRDHPRQLPQERRPGGEPGPRGGGPARAPQGREDLRARTRCPRRSRTSSSDENLATLRELALREVAESLDRGAAAHAPASGRRPSRGRPGGRVMVCMSSYPPRAATLLRRGSRMAGRLNTDWFVVYVETPEEAPHLHRRRGPAPPARQHREGAASWARRWCACKATDPVAALLDFARSHGVGHIIVGRSHQPWWRQLLGRVGRTCGWCARRTGFDVHVVAFETPSEERGHDAARPSCCWPRRRWRWRWSLVGVAGRASRSGRWAQRSGAHPRATTTAACSPRSG